MLYLIIVVTFITCKGYGLTIHSFQKFSKLIGSEYKEDNQITLGKHISIHT